MIIGFWEKVRHERLKRTGEYLDDVDIDIRKNNIKVIDDYKIKVIDDEGVELKNEGKRRK